MADERINETPASVEATDRGLFDFMKKKEDTAEGCKTSETEVITSGVEKIHVSEPECKKEEKKHGGLLEKLHHDSSSSSSSDEEGDDEEKKKRRKERKEKKKAGLKEKLDEKLHHDHDTNVPIENVHVEENVYSTPPSYPEPAAPDHHHQETEEKKGGLLDKIKDKMPGQHKNHKPDEHDTAAPAAPQAEPCAEVDKEKKGFLDKIKEKIPGFHSKSETEEKKDHD